MKSVKNFIRSIVGAPNAPDKEIEMSEDDPDNGFVLNSHLLPEEVLIHILSFVDPESLGLRCRKVCKVWHELITDTIIWKSKIARSNVRSGSKYEDPQKFKKLIEHYPWYLYYWILKGDNFEKNLLRNNCGQEKLEHWRVLRPTTRNCLGNQYWNIEDPPLNADPLPTSPDFGNHRCCFSTSYVWCSKEQVIDLRASGFSSKILDEYQPTIRISEWYAGRYDCACEYSLSVALLDRNKQIVVEAPPIYRARSQWQGLEWNKVGQKIKFYGSGVRYIRFKHEGKDRQYWAGNYGSKMAGAVVRLSFPEIRDGENAEEPLITLMYT